jgi:hypothetical protein
MLEQWWNVMASLDNAGSTAAAPVAPVAPVAPPPLPAAAPVAPAAPPPLPAARAAPVGPPPLPAAARVAPTQELISTASPYSLMDPEDELTVRRQRPPGIAMLVLPPAVAASPPSTEPPPDSAPGGERTMFDASPPTIPHPEASEFPNDWSTDEPTRADPNLRKLVEQELELQRKRKQPPR